MIKILICSPVRQKPEILRKFLDSLEGLDTSGLKIHYAFVNDNEYSESMSLLNGWLKDKSIILYKCPRDKYNISYQCDETTHKWTNDLVNRVAAFKNQFIRLTVARNYDYLFLVDSDLVLHPATLKHLISCGKDIVSEVFWTCFNPDQDYLPNVWQVGHYGMSQEFLDQLLIPGTYPVGGMGACTLISRKALQAGVSFSEIPNLGYGGEDRYFSIRAATLGIDLWCDTHYPAYHIYRESELAALPVWKDRQRERGSRITVGMLVHNEADRYLRQVLEQVKGFADNIVILDDASDDDTVKVCLEELGENWICNDESVEQTVFCSLDDIYTPGQGERRIVQNKEPGFHNEINLRKQLWDLCVAQGNDWIMILDADEIFESRAIEFTDGHSELVNLAANTDAEVYCFRLFDMWSPTHYRSDSLWNAHLHYGPYMIRYIPGFDYTWLEQPLHCGRFPNNCGNMNVVCSDLRLKHLGWSTLNDRIAKHKRYLNDDPNGTWGILAQYMSILDEHPHLVEWHDPEKKPTISLCMIVKDEEKNLPRCLESVKGVVDEIIVVDTGSTDETVAIAEDFGVDKMLFYGWHGDFSEARNAVMKQTTCDWILYLDADEELTPASRDLLPGLLTNDQIEGHLCVVTNQLGDQTNQAEILRLFRNRPEYRFTGKIHEQIADSIIAANPGRTVIGMSPLEILHYGYTPESIAGKDKVARNLAMFEANPPLDGDQLGHYHYGTELMRAERWGDSLNELIAASTGVNTQQIYFPRLIRGMVMCLYNLGTVDLPKMELLRHSAPGDQTASGLRGPALLRGVILLRPGLLVTGIRLLQESGELS